ncbi:hypothetical protein [Paenibacillus jilunlii]|uniref:Uncharacterized protein n=1 Tax=Paenibacillus jilunlii TaxID=682956 RepID=A0A1G9S1S5_9BACL|nr:hypothetical protein [Paenibacillus jilunlii]KWX77728.1 hypothetical protein AML91_06780 [Paenibacillus jilunlii]SDM29217.1 hypothetical protein SAMN05216191_1119 [Paenibacillus jilunlii]
MKRNRKYVSWFTGIYAAVVILTLGSLVMLGFADSVFRTVVSMIALLTAETAVYAYSLFWLRTVGNAKRTPPVLLSGALIMAVYTAVVFFSAIVLDWMLALQPYWYAGEQLTVLILSTIALGAIGLYGWNAGVQEQRTADAGRNLRLHLMEITEIGTIARTWNNPGAEELKQLLMNLEEQFKYSDPISDPAIYETEDIIRQQISLLHDHVVLLLVLQEPPADWRQQTESLAESIASTLRRRNRELAALK